jgi:hypothetical protein
MSYNIDNDLISSYPEQYERQKLGNISVPQAITYLDEINNFIKSGNSGIINTHANFFKSFVSAPPQKQEFNILTFNSGEKGIKMDLKQIENKINLEKLKDAVRTHVATEQQFISEINENILQKEKNSKMSNETFNKTIQDNIINQKTKIISEMKNINSLINEVQTTLDIMNTKINYDFSNIKIEKTNCQDEIKEYFNSPKFQNSGTLSVSNFLVNLLEMQVSFNNLVELQQQKLFETNKEEYTNKISIEVNNIKKVYDILLQIDENIIFSDFQLGGVITQLPEKKPSSRPVSTSVARPPQVQQEILELIFPINEKNNKKEKLLEELQNLPKQTIDILNKIIIVLKEFIIPNSFNLNKNILTLHQIINKQLTNDTTLIFDNIIQNLGIAIINALKFFIENTTKEKFGNDNDTYIQSQEYGIKILEKIISLTKTIDNPKNISFDIDKNIINIYNNKIRNILKDLPENNNVNNIFKILDEKYNEQDDDSQIIEYGKCNQYIKDYINESITISETIQNKDNSILYKKIFELQKIIKTNKNYSLSEKNIQDLLETFISKEVVFIRIKQMMDKQISKKAKKCLILKIYDKSGFLMYKNFVESLTKEIPYNQDYLKILLHNLFEKPTFNNFIKSILIKDIDKTIQNYRANIIECKFLPKIQIILKQINEERKTKNTPIPIILQEIEQTKKLAIINKLQPTIQNDLKIIYQILTELNLNISKINNLYIKIDGVQMFNDTEFQLIQKQLQKIQQGGDKYNRQQLDDILNLMSTQNIKLYKNLSEYCNLSVNLKSRYHILYSKMKQMNKNIVDIIFYCVFKINTLNNILLEGFDIPNIIKIGDVKKYQNIINEISNSTKSNAYSVMLKIASSLFNKIISSSSNLSDDDCIDIKNTNYKFELILCIKFCLDNN